MADTFGNPLNGRAFEGGKFYAVPSVAVPAGAIYTPAAGCGFFGVAEFPAAKDTLGAFATMGVFLFDKPDGWTSVAGQAVYYTRTNSISGTFKSSPSTGDILIGYEVPANTAGGKLAIYLASDVSPHAEACDATVNTKQSAIASITPSGSGTASDTFATSTATAPTETDFNNLSASIATKLNAILSALRSADIIAAD